jgi:hypothetical protein
LYPHGPGAGATISAGPRSPVNATKVLVVDDPISRRLVEASLGCAAYDPIAVADGVDEKESHDGGEEFLVSTPGCDAIDGVELAERLRACACATGIRARVALRPISPQARGRLGCFHAITCLNYDAHVGTLASTLHFGNSACLKNSALVCASGVNNSKLL